MRFVEAELGGFFESLRAHLGQVDGGAECEQALIRADVAGGFFAANVLLAGLQCEHPATAAAAIDGLTGDAAGHAADELLFAGHDSEVRATIEQWSAERLAFSDGDIRAEIAGPLEKAEADWIER